MKHQQLKIELKDIVCTLEHAKELHKLGISQDSLFYWFPDPNLPEIKKKYKLPDYHVISGDEFIGDEIKNIKWCVLNGLYQKTYSAFTIQELKKLANLKTLKIKTRQIINKILTHH